MKVRLGRGEEGVKILIHVMKFKLMRRERFGMKILGWPARARGRAIIGADKTANTQIIAKHHICHPPENEKNPLQAAALDLSAGQFRLERHCDLLLNRLCG